MRTGQALRIALVLSGAALLAGCSQTGTTFPRRTTVGSLKASVSQLEFENDKLRREVAQLKTDASDIEDRLVQEETENGTLRAKLDGARNLLSERGHKFGDDDDWGSLSRNGERPDSATTLPAGQSTRKRRKPPAVQIPGRMEVVDPDDDEHVIAPARRSRDAVGSQSRLFGDNERWLPIAQGSTSAATKK
jgi:outer membrane murein-binding lipoprotein Lpp